MPRLFALAFCLLMFAPFAAAAEVITLKDLNLKPDLRLGHTVSVEGLLTRGIEKQGDRRVLPLGFSAQSKPSGLKFVAAATLAEPLFESLKTESASVRVIGTVVAPPTANAPYTIEVDEVIVLKADGTVEATFKPVATVATKPAVAAPVATPQVEPAKEPEGLSTGTILAAAIAVSVGLGVAGFLLWRRKSRTPATPPPPTRSVSERLNRRVR